MYPIQICIYFYIFFFFYRSHFGAPARRKAGMRKNSESQPDGDALRRVQKTPMKAKGHVYLRDLEGKLQLLLFAFI